MLSLLKYYGGKSYLAKWIIQKFPLNYQQMYYYEPFCGGAAVFFHKKPSPKEVLSDIDGGCINLFWELKHNLSDLQRYLYQVTYSKEWFERAKGKPTTNTEWAAFEFILSKMSRSGDKVNFSNSERLRGGRPEGENNYYNTIKRLPIYARRLQNTISWHKPWQDALTPEVLRNPQNLIYLDPPYLHSTRVSKNVYRYEMTEPDHEELLDVICSEKHSSRPQASICLSGYESPLYNKRLRNWTDHTKDIVAHTSSKKQKDRRVEHLWTNF